MSQPAQPPAQPNIPGLITANGVTPAMTAVQPVPATQPGTTAPPAGQAGAMPAPIGQSVQPGPPAPAAPPAPQQAPVMQLPSSFAPQTTTTSGHPGITVTVPGLNPPAQQPAQPPAGAPDQQPSSQPPATGDPDRGYPQGTPLEQMTGEQREAYWKFHARKWEQNAKEKGDYDALKSKAGQYDQLVASQATEQEKAILEARAEGERTATARAAVVLVDAHVRAGLQQRLQPHQVEALAGNLNHQHFLAADGLTVDAAKVQQFVETVAPSQFQQQPAAMAPAAPAVPGALPVGVPPAGQLGQPATGLPRTLPDLGQGTQTTAPLDKLEAGRQQARAFLANGGYR
jgi:hypothetical protein